MQLRKFNTTENAAARQLKEHRAAAFAVKKLMGGSLPYAGDRYSHTSLIWILPQASPASPFPDGVIGLKTSSDAEPPLAAHKFSFSTCFTATAGAI